MKVLILGKLSYNKIIRPGQEDRAVEVDEGILAELGKTKVFDVENNCVIDYVPEQIKLTDEQKRLEYERKTEQLIRERYSISQELAILRQRDTKPDEFNEYYAYAEECKAQARNEIGI